MDFLIANVKTIFLLHLIFWVYSSNIRSIVLEKKNDNLLCTHPISIRMLFSKKTFLSSMCFPEVTHNEIILFYLYFKTVLEKNFHLILIKAPNKLQYLLSILNLHNFVKY